MKPSDFQRDMTEDGRRFRIRDHHGEWQVYGTAALRHICYCGDLVTAHMVAEALEKAAEGCANQIVPVSGNRNESPDDWVPITDPEHTMRPCDYLSDYGTQWYPLSDLTGALGKPFGKCGFLKARCRRSDHPDFQQPPQGHNPPSDRDVTIYDTLFIESWRLPNDGRAPGVIPVPGSQTPQ